MEVLLQTRGAVAATRRWDPLGVASVRLYSSQHALNAVVGLNIPNGSLRTMWCAGIAVVFAAHSGLLRETRVCCMPDSGPHRTVVALFPAETGRLYFNFVGQKRQFGR
ncbi:MAG: hypothetical protein EOO38_06945 [Cytophagaceae bacterium]|nr:MAG: hypothetical protein EOO38_06945 [Cytophagaceae bacterium]